MTIYFIGGDFNAVKIGFTDVNAEERVSSLQTGCPCKLRVLATAEGSKDTEYSLHQFFAGSRVEGEWFYPTQHLMSLISHARSGLPIVSWFSSVDVDTAELERERIAIKIERFDVEPKPHARPDWLSIYRKWSGLSTQSGAVIDETVSETRKALDFGTGPSFGFYERSGNACSVICGGGYGATAEKLATHCSDREKGAALWFQIVDRTYSADSVEHVRRYHRVAPYGPTCASEAQTVLLARWVESTKHFVPSALELPDYACLSLSDWIQFVALFRSHTMSVFGIVRLVDE
jgi:hypothetical protein